MGKYKKGPYERDTTKQSGAQPNLGYYKRNISIKKRTPLTPHPLPTPVANALKKQTIINCLQNMMGFISQDW